MFVFLVIFSYFAVPAALQHRVLFWGILGALVMRALFILAGAALIERFHWLVYVFGGFLLLHRDPPAARPGRRDPSRAQPGLPASSAASCPLVKDYRGSRFVVQEGGRRYATPLLLVLVVVEATDVVFAVDSIPAIFAITTDPFIVYTSNIFAILGLRSLFFVLAGAMSQLPPAEARARPGARFVGAKMLVADLVEIPILVSLGVVAALLAGARSWARCSGRAAGREPRSLAARRRKAPRPAPS